MLAASHLDGGRCTACIILNIIEACDSSKSLILFLVVVIARQRCLEAAVCPVSRVLGLLTAAAAHLVLEAGTVLLELNEARI